MKQDPFKDLKKCFHGVIDQRELFNRVIIYPNSLGGYCSIYTNGEIECDAVLTSLQFDAIIKLREMIRV